MHTIRFMSDDDIANDTLLVANQLRDVLGRHIAQFSDNQYREALTSCLIALCIEVGRLRYLCTVTDEVTEDSFDQTFWNSTMKHFHENELQYGEAVSH